MRMVHCRQLFLIGLLFTLVSAAFTANPVAAQSETPTGYAFRVYLPVITLSTVANPIEQQVVALTNQLRAQHGCPALTISPELSAAARAHSQDMALSDFFSHTGSNGSSLADRATAAGYQSAMLAENLAAGYATAEQVVNGWYNETPPNDGHRKNILNCSLNEIGVGYFYLADDAGNMNFRSYWTQDFGTR